MRKIVDCLSQNIAAKFLIGRNLRHGKIGLIQFCSLTVDPNEYFGYFINRQFFVQRNDADLSIFYSYQIVQNIMQFIGICFRIEFAILVDKTSPFEIGFKHFGNVCNPFFVFQYGIILNLKNLFFIYCYRIKGNFNPFLFEICVD